MWEHNHRRRRPGAGESPGVLSHHPSSLFSLYPRRQTSSVSPATGENIWLLTFSYRQRLIWWGSLCHSERAGLSLGQVLTLVQSYAVTWYKHGCQQPVLGDQRRFGEKRKGELGAGPITPKVFIFGGNFMRALTASLRAASGTSIFRLIEVAQQAPLSEDCPVFTRHSTLHNV